MIYQYDVKLSVAKFPAKLSRAAFRQVEVLMKKVHPTAWFVYDGQALAFSSAMIKECSFSVIVDKNMDMIIPPLPQSGIFLRYRIRIIFLLIDSRPSSGRGGRGGGDRGGRGGDRGGRGGGRGGFSRDSGRSEPEYEVPSDVLLPVSILLDSASNSKDHETITVTIKPTTQVSMHELLLHASGKGIWFLLLVSDYISHGFIYIGISLNDLHTSIMVLYTPLIESIMVLYTPLIESIMVLYTH